MAEAPELTVVESPDTGDIDRLREGRVQPKHDNARLFRPILIKYEST